MITDKNKRGLWGILLVVSLMANMFFLGMFVSHPHGPNFGPDGGPGGGPQSHTNRMLDAARDLPDGKRQLVKSIIKTHAATMDARMETMHGLFEDMKKTMTAETLDKGAVNAILKQIDATDIALKNEMKSTVLAIADALTPAERVAFFDRMFARPPFDGPRGGPDDKDTIPPTE